MMKPKIMVVEDEAVVALNLRHALSRLGYEVPCIAASYDQALQGARATRPDLVLMDINISGHKDGIDTAAAIDIPVIYLTAYAEQSTLDRAKATKPHGYLLKPFSERELHATLQMALERCRIEEELRESRESLAAAYVEIQTAKDQLEAHATELRHQKERLLVTLNAIADGVVTTDDRGLINFINPAAAEMTGWDPAEACGQPSTSVMDLRDAETGNRFSSPIETALLTGKSVGMPANCALVDRSGDTRLVEDSVALIRDRDRKVIGAVMVFHDVSVARQLAEEMTYQATHDPLTGLFQPAGVRAAADQSHHRRHGDPQSNVLAYLDLDQFKIINDICGHAAGDETLRQVTKLLRAPLRASDCLARLGGDEFGVLLEGCQLDEATRVVEAMKKLINDFHFVWGDRVFPIGVSIGLVSFGGKDDRLPLELNEILRLADSACYTAKEGGRNGIHTYVPDDKLLTKIHDEMDWYGRIHRALRENRFVLYAQPIMAFGHQTEPFEHHLEILLRMRDAQGKIVPPGAFLPAAERYGLMRDIDRWVIRKAFEAIASSGTQERSLFAINLSGGSLNDEGVLRFIDQQLDIWKIRPQAICFEITETSAISNMLTARAFITMLRARGCRFALDDFGSGMASFAYLKHFKVDFLKIDGSFVKDMMDNPVDAAMVQAINGIGQVMGIQTIAEYVENDDITQLLMAGGIDYGQGYALGRPVPLETLLTRPTVAALAPA
ncbi:EAL domain-containing protein [Azospirillum sp. B4]|uniref:EAL domain-containing protein n=1 Tax=Azospirillum sp. B4 TaxID=95605 RepID=UPI0005C89449|nr:EAL domain-containing protein [Azospirillum sp. B4]